MKNNHSMHRLRQLAASALISGALLSLAGCKTTEANYQRAYEVAKAKKDAAYTADELAAASAERPVAVYNGDTIPMRGEFLRPVRKGDGQGVIRHYTVVTGKFRQEFNATDMRRRLAEGGFPGAILANDRSNHFYVGAVTAESLDSAVTALRKLQENSPVGMAEGYPVIIRRGN